MIEFQTIQIDKHVSWQCSVTAPGSGSQLVSAKKYKILYQKQNLSKKFNSSETTKGRQLKLRHMKDDMII